MKKNILFQRLLTGIVLLLFFSTVSAKKIKVKSPGNHRDIQPSIQAAVDKAANGDQLILPEGEFIINRSVVITKFISIKGQGLKKTILYRSEEVPDKILARDKEWHGIFRYEINSTRPSNIVVSGINFKSKKPSVTAGDGLSLAGDIGVEFIKCVDFVITECRFEYFGDAAVNIIHEDSLARGLICKNEFYHNAKGADGLGLGYGVTIYGVNQKWIKDPKFGSSNFIFIEDNLFDYHRHSVAAGGCALYVFRHNIVLNNIVPGGHAVDTHSARGPGNGNNTFGTRAVEVYNNKLLNTTYLDGSPIIPGKNEKNLENSGIGIRSGDALVFNNDVRGYRIAVKLSNYLLSGTVQSYPIPYAPGYLSGLTLGPGHSGINSPEGDGDAFFWNNTNRPFVDGANDSSTVFGNAFPLWWIEGRDYHLVSKPGYKPYPYPIKKTKPKNLK